MLRNNDRPRRPRFITFAATTALALMAWPGVVAAGEQDGSSWKGAARDAWLDGRIEAAFALNEHLNPFEIDTNVEGGEVQLSGAVDSQIDKDLAEEVARSVSGVSRVDNALKVEPDAPRRDRDAEGGERDLAGRVSDATTTARVKMALLGNQSTSGLAINVDTERGVVMLKGEVDSEQEGDLAEQIASNTDGVSRVDNRLRAKSDS